MDYNVKIDTFEGPLDLLLHLIKESNINIYDISIDTITKQYLDYINKMEELNINIASSYLVMASELLEIKSKSLLPKKTQEELPDDYEENTREKLIQKLLDYQRYKEVTKTFKEFEQNRQNIYIKEPERIDKYLDAGLKNSGLTEHDLYEAMQKFLERKNLEKPLNTKITTKEYSVNERKKNIKEKLLIKKKTTFTELFDISTKSYIVVTFLAILELTRENDINLTQEHNFDEIIIELRDQ